MGDAGLSARLREPVHYTVPPQPVSSVCTVPFHRPEAPSGDAPQGGVPLAGKNLSETVGAPVPRISTPQGAKMAL
jgi:hypothetical protein